MKQETNNEMDLLLRQLARRPDVFAPGAEDHLDADELSAYAENALPVKTRARYTEHLAECSRCRELVVQLGASVGVVIAAQADKVPGPSGWRKFLAGLFSPMVLKYAAPALGLIVVAAIGFVVLRRDKAADYVSHVQNNQPKLPNVAEHVESPEKGLMNDSAPKPADTTANKEARSNASTDQPTTPAPQGTPAVVEQNAPAPVVKAPEAKPESQPSVAAEPPSPDPTKLAYAKDAKERRDEVTARKQEVEVKVAPAEESKKDFEVDGAKRGEAPAPASARARAAKSKSVVGDLSAAQGAGATANRQREEAGRDDKDSSAETRSVAGRQFRKQGGIWVDTAYDQSRAITTYRRDSESYRSLIADEPAIKNIADQLDGEIIVVWKGRAYRIR